MTYSEQLQHPKWQRRRLEIMNRDGFKCRRCGSEDVLLNVHHIRYKRGAAPWDYADKDLITLCKNCHKAEHGLFQIPKLKFYLAGKISKNDWRHSIVEGLKRECQDYVGSYAYFHIPNSICGRHDYMGPFFIGCDHGCFHGDGTHGCSGHEHCMCSEHALNTGRGAAFESALSNIAQANVFFAWIDGLTCFGTLAEIGFAYARGIPIIVATPHEDAVIDDIWFAMSMANCCVVRGPTAKDCLEAVIPELERRYPNVVMLHGGNMVVGGEPRRSSGGPQ